MTTARQWRQASEAVAQQLLDRGVLECKTYDQWTEGDILNIQGEAGVFNFQSVRLDGEGNPLWANVWGGPKGQEASRSFALDRLEPYKGRIKRRGRKTA